MKLKNKIKEEYREMRLLLRSVPPVVLTVFVASLFAMNLLANKSISLPFEWLALDCGIIVSWAAFLTMDMVTTHFGPKASNTLSVLAILLNLLLCFLLFVGSKIPGVWGESYVPGIEGQINGALDHTFGGTWYVLAGSTLAFIVSAFVNNFVNFSVGRLFGNSSRSFVAYVTRSYVSTAIGQFVDNLVFAFAVSRIFFGWSTIQCITCAVTGMLVELATEALFSVFGYKITDSWKRGEVGKEYIEYVTGGKEEVKK